MEQNLGTCDICGAKDVECVGMFNGGGIEVLCKTCYSAHKK